MTARKVNVFSRYLDKARPVVVELATSARSTTLTLSYAEAREVRDSLNKFLDTGSHRLVGTITPTTVEVAKAIHTLHKTEDNRYVEPWEDLGDAQQDEYLCRACEAITVIGTTQDLDAAKERLLQAWTSTDEKRQSPANRHRISAMVDSVAAITKGAN